MTDEKIESATSRRDIFGDFGWMDPPVKKSVDNNPVPRRENLQGFARQRYVFDDEATDESTKSWATTDSSWTPGPYINSGDIAIFAKNGYDDSATRSALTEYLTRSKTQGARYLQSLVSKYFAFPRKFSSRKLVPDPFGIKNVDFAIVIDDTIKGMIEVDCFNQWTTLHDLSLDELRLHTASLDATIGNIIRGETLRDHPCFKKSRSQIYNQADLYNLVKWKSNYTHVHFLERKYRYMEKPYPYLHLSFSSNHTAAVAYIRETIENTKTEEYIIKCQPKVQKKDKVRRIPLDQCFMIDFKFHPPEKSTLFVEYGNPFYWSYDMESTDMSQIIGHLKSY